MVDKNLNLNLNNLPLSIDIYLRDINPDGFNTTIIKKFPFPLRQA